VLVALLLPFGLPFGAGGAAHASGRTRLVRATAQPPAVPAPAPLLRIVGCRARTAAAYRGGPRVRAVALGFDDGPASDTGAFVSMLERAHASATFFMIGAQLQGGYRSLLLRELRDGDVLGDHSFNHPDLTLSGNVAGQLRWTLAAIRQLSGYTPCVFRPPYGAYNASVVRTAASLGLATVLWNDDPRDWALPAPARSCARCSHRCSPARSSSPTTAAARAGRRWAPTRRSSPACAPAATESSRSLSCSASAPSTDRASSSARASGSHAGRCPRRDHRTRAVATAVGGCRCAHVGAA